MLHCYRHEGVQVLSVRSASLKSICKIYETCDGNTILVYLIVPLMVTRTGHYKIGFPRLIFENSNRFKASFIKVGCKISPSILRIHDTFYSPISFTIWKRLILSSTFSNHGIILCSPTSIGITRVLVMAALPVNPRQRRLSEAASDEDFDSRIALASSASLASMLGGRLESQSSGKEKKTPGPKPSMVKIRMYYLPDLSEIPVFRKTPLDERILQHSELGYGEFTLHFILCLHYDFSRRILSFSVI